MSSNLIAEHLTCKRSERVLFSDISFSIDSGQALQIKGENGAGKTSLIRILLGLTEPECGHILWQGQRLSHCRAHYHQVLLYLGHKANIKLELSPLENLQSLLDFHRVEQSQTDLEQALDSIGLYGFEDIPCRMLSAGQQRKVGLARLYCTHLNQPGGIWILDEPYTALDEHSVQWVNQRLEQHLDQGGLLVLTSHQAIDLPQQSIKSIQVG